MTNCNLFKPMHLQPPLSIKMWPDPERIHGKSRGLYHYRWKMWLGHLVDNESASMLREHKKYQKGSIKMYAQARTIFKSGILYLYVVSMLVIEPQYSQYSAIFTNWSPLRTDRMKSWHWVTQTLQLRLSPETSGYRTLGSPSFQHQVRKYCTIWMMSQATQLLRSEYFRSEIQTNHIAG